MKKILFITLYYYPECGSSDYYLEDIKKHLIDNGLEVATVAPNPVRGLSKETINKYSAIKNEQNESGVVYRLFCGKNSSNSFVVRSLRIFRFKRNLKKFIKENHKSIDAIYIPSNPPIFIPLMVEKLCKKYGIKSVYSITDIWPNITGKFGFLKRWSIKAVNNADKIITLSEDMKDTLAQTSKRNDVEIIRIWPHKSMNDNFSSNKNYEDGNYHIFYIGNIGYFQNIDLVLDVAKELIQHTDVKFHIVGSGRRVEKIIKIINDNKLLNVEYMPRVTNEEASSLYKAASLNLISLTSGTVSYACPSKTSTCIYARKPCLLLLNKSKYSEQLLKNGYFVLNDSFESKDIAKQILMIKNQVFDLTNHIDIYKKETNLAKWLNIFKT